MSCCCTKKELTVGLIGLDTSHVTAFTKLLNDKSDPNHVPGAKVVAAFPGGSKDFDLSISRVEGFTKELKEKFSVEILDTPEQVAEKVDLVFVESVDGRVHREQVQRTAKYKKPMFVDKPLALTSADAKAIFQAAKTEGIPLMSSSSLRYADPVVAAMMPFKDKMYGPVAGCDIVGPMLEQATQPGLFWYGIHTVEMLYTVMGRGCQKVQTFTNADFDLVTAVWTDGRMATLRGNRKGHGKFAGVVHRQTGYELMNDVFGTPRAPYATMLQAIIEALSQGRSAIDENETMEIIRFIEAANESRANGGKVVIL